MKHETQMNLGLLISCAGVFLILIAMILNQDRILSGFGMMGILAGFLIMILEGWP